MRDYDHFCPSVEWSKIARGEKLTKFIATDDATKDGDYSVELHGFWTESGELIITDAILKKKGADAK